MSIVSKLLEADTRDIMSLLITVLLILGTMNKLFDAQQVLLIIGMVFSYWFASKAKDNGDKPVV